MLYEGYVDNITSEAVTGWAYNIYDGESSVKLDVFIDGLFHDTFVADVFRSDLEQAGKGDGFHGFEYIFRQNAKGKHIEIKLHDSDHALPLSAESLNMSINEKEIYETRRRFASLFIKGKGIEIGALNSPLPVHAGAETIYVDRVSEADLKAHYPEINPDELVEVNVVDNGETLYAFDDQSLDYVIASHFLEHTENPVSTIGNFLRTLKKGGIAFIIIPDKRFTFDRCRPIHGFDHIRKDFTDGPELSRLMHFREWIYFVERFRGEKGIEKRADELMKQEYSIHFHVWTRYEIIDMFSRLKREFLFPFKTLLIRQNESEVICILQKTG